MTKLTRRAALAMLGAGACLLGVGYVLVSSEPRVTPRGYIGTRRFRL